MMNAESSTVPLRRFPLPSPCEMVLHCDRVRAFIIHHSAFIISKRPACWFLDFSATLRLLLNK
jgi:hypothetical protein